MKFYGTIETNLGKLCREYGLNSYISIDSLMFETEDAESFWIDFEETDISIEDDVISFRLKSLGLTFMDSWKDAGMYEVETLETIKTMENNTELFKKVKLRNIAIYISDDDGKIDNEFIKKLTFEVIENLLVVNTAEIINNNEEIEVELFD